MAQAERSLNMKKSKINPNLPFFYLKSDLKTVKEVVWKLNSLLNDLCHLDGLAPDDKENADRSFHDVCERFEYCAVEYVDVIYEDKKLYLIYLPFDCYEFRRPEVRKLFAQIINQELILFPENAYMNLMYKGIKDVLDLYLIDPSWYSVFAAVEADWKADRFYNLRFHCLNSFLIWFNNNIKEIDEPHWDHIVKELTLKNQAVFFGLSAQKTNQIINVNSPVYLNYYGEDMFEYERREEHFKKTGTLV